MTLTIWWRLCLEEVLGILARPGIYVGAVFLAGLSLASIGQSRADLQGHWTRYNEGLQDRLQAQLRIPAPNGRAVDPGLRLLRPPTVSTILVPSGSALLPSGWDVGPAGIEARPPYSHQGSGRGAGVSLGIDGIVLVFGGLLAAALGCFQVLNARGSNWSSALRMMPVAWYSVVSARLVASAVLVGATLSIWWVIVVALVGLIEPVSASELRWTLLHLLVPTFSYLVTLNWSGMAVALWSSSSLKGVVAGLALWVAVTFVLPPALVLIFRTTVPQESRHAMERARQEAFADEIAQFEDSIGRTIAIHAPTHQALSDLENIDDPPIQHLHLDDVWRAGIAKARSVARAYDSEWRTRQVLRRKLLNIGIALSPATAMTEAISELAGVGEAADEAWESAAANHHEALTKVLFDDRPMLNSMVPVGTFFTSFGLIRHPPRTHEVFPSFQAPTQDWRFNWQGASQSIVWLVFHAALALIWAYSAGIRDLRRDV